VGPGRTLSHPSVERSTPRIDTTDEKFRGRPAGTYAVRQNWAMLPAVS